MLLLFAATKAEAQTSALAIADSLYAVGNYSGAINELENSEIRSEAVLLKLAQAQKANGNILAALENYEAVMKSSPERILTAVEYAKLLSSTGNLQEADSIFTSLTKRHPMNAGFHYQLGLIREKRKDSTAMSHYNITVLLQKTHQEALIKVATRALTDGELLRGERLSKQGLETNPNGIALLSILAQSYYYQKEFKQAVERFEKLVELGAGSEFVHSKLGTAYFHLEDYDKAIAHFNLALDYEDENHATHYSLGKLYALVGDYKNSEGHLLQAILLKDVILDEEFTSLGLTYKLQEKPKDALKYFNLAIEEDPYNERAMYERAIAADSYFKDLESRKKYYEEYLERFQENGGKNLVLLAQRRIKDLKEEIHMQAAALEKK
ncbi:tetratricopeptide repeat protein [Salinimicrobium sp. CDJ15-91]|uniref:Tetratricopeptide repeat protein n=1 Tax=Salinimicrobium oceani TaxID=2722702 RepID=A0ABX1CX53_9FLAO|nr:tetratricopeptide repeat protein [Salinimicrobium oceani]